MHCIFMDYISQILIVIPGRNKKNMETDEAIPLKISYAYREKNANCCQFSIVKDGWKFEEISLMVFSFDDCYVVNVWIYWVGVNTKFTTWQQIVMLEILYLNQPSKLKIHNMTRFSDYSWLNVYVPYSGRTSTVGFRFEKKKVWMGKKE